MQDEFRDADDDAANEEEAHVLNEEIDETIVDGNDENNASDADDEMADTDEVADLEVGDNEETMEFLDDSEQAFYGHNAKAVYTIALHPLVQNICCSGGGDDKTFLWNTQTGLEVLSLPAHTDSVIQVSFSADGTLIATAGMDGVIHVTQLSCSDGSSVTSAGSITLEGPTEITCTSWHPRGHVLLSGTAEGQVWMFNAATAQTMSVFSCSSSAVSCCKFTADGKHMLVSSEDGLLTYWDPRNAAKPLWRFGSDDDGRWHETSVLHFDVPHGDGAAHQVVVTGGDDSSAKVTQLDSGRLLASLDGHTDGIEAVSLCDVMPLCATGSLDCTVRVWDLTTMQTRIILRHEGAVTVAKFVEKSPLLVTGSTDHTVKLWDCRSGECLKTWNGQQDTVLSVDVNQRFVVSGGDDGVALVFHR